MQRRLASEHLIKRCSLARAKDAYVYAQASFHSFVRLYVSTAIADAQDEDIVRFCIMPESVNYACLANE